MWAFLCLSGAFEDLARGGGVFSGLGDRIVWSYTLAGFSNGDRGAMVRELDGIQYALFFIFLVSTWR